MIFAFRAKLDLHTYGMLPHAASARAHRARTGSTGLQQDGLVGAQPAQPGSNDTVDTAQMNESLSLEECIRRRQRQETMHSTPLVSGDPEPSRRPRISLPESGRQHLERAAYEFDLDRLQRRYGDDSRQWAHKAAYRTGRQGYEDDPEYDDQRQTTLEQRDQLYAETLQEEFDQERATQARLQQSAAAEAQAEVSSQYGQEDAEARNRLAAVADDPSYAAALQRTSSAMQTRSKTNPTRQTQDRPDMAALRNSIQKAQQNVNDMRAKKKKTVQIPPRTSLPIPAADDPWAQAAEEEQLDWGLPDSPVAARTTDRIPIPASRPHVQQAAQATIQPEHAPAQQTAAQARFQPAPANQTAAHARSQHVPAPRQAPQPDQRVAYYAAPAKPDPADYFHLPVQNLSHP